MTDYIDEIVMLRNEFLAETDGGGVVVPCAHCGGSGQFADEYEGMPACYGPCPYCESARAAIEVSLATIAPAFEGLL